VFAAKVTVARLQRRGQVRELAFPHVFATWARNGLGRLLFFKGLPTNRTIFAPHRNTFATF
jgi:hypothetical protein